MRPAWFLAARRYNDFAAREHLICPIGSIMSDDRETAENPVPQNRPAAGEAEPMLYCPVCSLRLSERRCKLLCERCGYYMSCADYY
jgi:hypothetical protein